MDRNVPSTVDRWQDPQRFLRIIDDPWFALLVTLQDRVTVATVNHWSARGLRTMHLPITAQSVSSPMGRGSDSLPVEVDLFGVRTYLVDSMQFMLEYGCRLWAEGAYYVMPSFRGEPADASHLCQFFHSEVEIPGGLDDVIAAAEGYVRHLCADLLSAAGSRLGDQVGETGHIEAVAARPAFERLSFTEAVAQLRDDPRFVTAHPDGWRTLTRSGERRLLEKVGAPVWVTHFDHLAVPFYQAYADDQRRFATNADLLLGMGEVIGAGERHPDGDSVRAALAHHEVSAEPYHWYVEMKSRHPRRTAGFGMGVERFLAWVLRHDDIRDLQVLPRFNGVATVP
jgi:asparaginyl-tRNA synthetase